MDLKDLCFSSYSMISMLAFFLVVSVSGDEARPCLRMDLRLRLELMEGDSSMMEGDSLHSPNPLSMLSLESDFSTPQLGPWPAEEQAADLEHGATIRMARCFQWRFLSFLSRGLYHNMPGFQTFCPFLVHFFLFHPRLQNLPKTYD